MAGDVTLIVPSVASRADMFRRVLIHFAQSGHDGPIVVSDHSAEDDRRRVSGAELEPAPSRSRPAFPRPSRRLRRGRRDALYGAACRRRFRVFPGAGVMRRLPRRQPRLRGRQGAHGLLQPRRRQPRHQRPSRAQPRGSQRLHPAYPPHGELQRHPLRGPSPPSSTAAGAPSPPPTMSSSGSICRPASRWCGAR